MYSTALQFAYTNILQFYYENIYIYKLLIIISRYSTWDYDTLFNSESA